MPARTTKTAWQQNLKNALMVIPGFLVAVLLLQQVLALTMGRNSHELVRIAVAMTCGFLLLLSMARWIHGRTIGGRILLDCGPYPGKRGCLSLGLVLILIGCSHLIARPEVLCLDGPWIEFSLAAYFFGAAFDRLQVRENGIMPYSGLLRWRAIASYHWAEDSTLRVSKRSLFSLPAALPVSPEQKQAVDELLTRFCPVGGQISNCQ